MGRDLDWEEQKRSRPDDEEKPGCGFKILVSAILWPVVIAAIGITEYIHPWS